MKTPPSEEAPPLKLPPPPKIIWRRCLGVFHHKNSSARGLGRSSHVSVMKNTSSSWLKINWVKSILVLVLLSILTSETWFHQIFMTKTLSARISDLFENRFTTIFFSFKTKNNQNQNMFSCICEHICLSETIKNHNQNMYSCTCETMSLSLVLIWGYFWELTCHHLFPIQD